MTSGRVAGKMGTLTLLNVPPQEKIDPKRFKILNELLDKDVENVVKH